MVRIFAALAVLVAFSAVSGQEAKRGIDKVSVEQKGEDGEIKIRVQTPDGFTKADEERLGKLVFLIESKAAGVIYSTSRTKFNDKKTEAWVTIYPGQVGKSVAPGVVEVVTLPLKTINLKEVTVSKEELSAVCRKTVTKDDLRLGIEIGELLGMKVNMALRSKEITEFKVFYVK